MVQTYLVTGSSKCTSPLIRGSAMSTQPAVSHPSSVLVECVRPCPCSESVLAIPRRVQMLLGHVDRRTANDKRVNEQVFGQSDSDGAVVAVRLCNGWLISAGMCYSRERSLLTERLGGCLGKEVKLQEAWRGVQACKHKHRPSPSVKC